MLKTFALGGIHPKENKLTAKIPCEYQPLPKEAVVMVSQHIGAPATVVVQKGDEVKTGQIVAKQGGFISSNIHSPVSGVVKKIEPVADAGGVKRNAITIEVTGDDWAEGIDRSENLIEEIKDDAKTIIQKISDAGIVGMGGATFPSHVKLMPPPGKTAKYLVINGVECEPYLTSDHRLMLEKGPEIVVGIEILMVALGVKQAFIGIENNKPDAIKAMKKLTSKKKGIKVIPLKVQYPQGGEKQLIKAILNKEVPSGALPIEVGAVVQNVGTAFAVYEAVQKNKPLIERVVTITGKHLSSPKNLWVRIGTPVSSLIEAAGGLPESTVKIISGGPMMGKAMSNLNAPVTKGTSGILVMAEPDTARKPASECIRCGKCVTVCPMGLQPYALMVYGIKQMYDKLEAGKVMDCIECGSCSYTCPANRELLDYIRLSKSRLGPFIRNRKS